MCQVKNLSEVLISKLYTVCVKLFFGNHYRWKCDIAYVTFAVQQCWIKTTEIGKYLEWNFDFAFKLSIKIFTYWVNAQPYPHRFMSITLWTLRKDIRCIETIHSGYNSPRLSELGRDAKIQCLIDFQNHIKPFIHLNEKSSTILSTTW